jgi:D-alanyl-D-alanine carboxypeptidase
MKKKNILFISFLASIPFWWGINLFSHNLQSFVFLKEIEKNPLAIKASLFDIKFPEKEINKIPQKELFANLDINAKAAVSFKISQTGEEILFAKNARNIMPIASIAKLMTALVVFDLKETYDLSDYVAITKSAVSQEGSSKYGDLKEGESLSVESLLNIMLLESSNDAAYALSEVIGKDSFVGLMNLYAKNIGLIDTHFVNPTGLVEFPSKDQNISSIMDLIVLTKYILANYPEIFNITVKDSFSVYNKDGTLHHFIPQSTNELLKEDDNWKVDIIGGKTGWTPSSDGCLLLVLENVKLKEYYIDIVLGADDRFAEMRKLVEPLNN